MENFNTTPSSFENPVSTIDPDKKAKKETKEKKSTSSETNRQKAEHDLAKSSLLGVNKESSLGVPNRKSAEQLTANETVELRQTIARDHREDIEQAGPETVAELAPAIDFLERLEDGLAPDEAFREAADELGIDDNVVEAALDEPVPEDATADDEASNFGEIPNQDDEQTAPPPTAGGSGGGRGPINPGWAFGDSLPSPEEPQPAASSSNSSYYRGLSPTAHNYYRQRQANSAAAVTSGLLGYTAGRRSGRRKAEKQFQPVVHKFEQQVTRLEQEITYKEQQLVAIMQPEKQSTVQPVNAEQPKARAVERTQPGRQETRLGMEKPIRAEHLGRVAVTTEAPDVRVIEKPVFERPNNIRQAFRPEHVKTMHRNELLELSEKIVIEGASLRHVYESHLIGEKQLRHLVSEYLEGKDIRRDLRRQMVEREIDFERDPQLRDRVRNTTIADKNSGLDRLLQTAGLQAIDSTMTPQEKRRAEKLALAEHKAKSQRRAADVSMATAIVILAIVVIVLLIR